MNRSLARRRVQFGATCYNSLRALRGFLGGMGGFVAGVMIVAPLGALLDWLTSAVTDTEPVIGAIAGGSVGLLTGVVSGVAIAAHKPEC